MPVGCGSCVDLLRGGLSWPGVVVLWTGLWTLLDRHVPGGTGLWKELGLAVVGAWVMVWTRTLFSNAGMDSLDYEGSLAEMGSLLAQGRLRLRDKAKFYVRSFLAIAGSILFWDGVYTLCDEHTWEGTLTYNLACASLGGAGMVWVMVSEDDDTDERGGLDPPLRFGGALEGKGSGGHFSKLSWVEKGRLYLKALFCNVCGVVFWKGVEETIEDIGPDEDWTGLVFFVVGISILLATERLSMNSGLDDGLPQGMELGHAPAGTWETTASASTSTTAPPRRSRPLFAESIVEDAFCPGCSWVVSEVGGAMGFGEEAGACRKRGDFCPAWVTTAMELTGVVFAWTGIEWYVWDDDYILDTWARDILYIGVGLGLLISTGTFFNLAGTISPVAALKHVHQHNRHEDAATTPLLSGFDDDFLPPDTSQLPRSPL
eukprot:g5906.t1